MAAPATVLLRASTVVEIQIPTIAVGEGECRQPHHFGSSSPKMALESLTHEETYPEHLRYRPDPYPTGRLQIRLYRDYRTPQRW